MTHPHPVPLDHVPGQRGGGGPVRLRRDGRDPFCLVGLDGCQVRPVGRAQARWMAEQRELIGELCDGSADAATLAALVRRVHERWSAQPRPADPGVLADLFGLAVGDLLCRRLPGLGWVQISDQRRCELALTHAHAPVAVFPLQAVARHWGGPSPTWVQSYVETTVDAVRASLDTVAVVPG